MGKPTSPTITELDPGDRKITVKFTPPSNTGGSEITKYQYKLNNEDLGFVNKTQSPITISNLTNGKPYNVKIRAVRGDVYGEWSKGEIATPGKKPTTPGKKPTTPVITRLDSGNRSITVVFENSDSNGENPITGYEYKLNDSEYVTANITRSPIIITGLTNGVRYKIQIRAKNAVGYSDESLQMIGTPATVPDAPQIKSHTFGDKQITVYFETPENGGSLITGYEYQLNDETYIPASGVDGTATQITITSFENGTTLKNGTEYTVKIRAKNAVGYSSDSDSIIQIPATVPTAPTITQLKSGDKYLMVYFNPPTMNGGSPITDYKYKLNSNNYESAKSSASPITITITQLTNGTPYTITIWATNKAGDSPPSNSLTEVPYIQPTTNGSNRDIVVGYSPGDYFYADVNYCSKTCGTSKNQYCKVNSDGTISESQESAYNLHQTITKDTACTANDLYGNHLKETNSQLHITTSKYRRSTEDYNRELLTTFNYMLGIGVLFGYIYVNNLLLPS